MPASITYVQNSLFAAQVDARKEDIADAFFEGTPLFAWAKTVRDDQSEGERCFLPVEYDENSTVSMIGKGGTVSLADSDPFSNAYYSKKTMAGNVTLFRNDATANRGEGMIFKLIDKKIDNLVKSMKTEFETQLVATSLTAGNINPLSTLVESTAEASQATTVGGISRSTYDWWRNSSESMTGQATDTYIQEYFQRGYDQVERIGFGPPDAILCDNQTHMDYENYALLDKQFIDTMIGDVSFKLMHYKGVPVIKVPKMSNARRAYFLTSSTIALFVTPDMWFEWTDWKEPDNQPHDKVRQVVCECQLGVANPRLNHVIFSIDT